jgi:hypothetical protein
LLFFPSVLQQRRVFGVGLVVQGLMASVVIVFEASVVEQQLRFAEGVEGLHLEQLPEQVAVDGFDAEPYQGAPGSMWPARTPVKRHQLTILLAFTAFSGRRSSAVT